MHDLAIDRPAARGPALVPRRILVVEDDDEDRRVYEQIFSKRGFDVKSAGTFTEAVAALAPAAWRRTPCCLAVVDLHFGAGLEQNGVMLLEHLLELQPRPMVVVVSGDSHVLDRVQVRMVADRAVLLLKKPAGYDLLFRLLAVATAACGDLPSSSRSELDNVAAFGTRWRLSPIEMTVLLCAMRGLRLKETAAALRMSTRTAREHRERITEAAEVPNWERALAKLGHEGATGRSADEPDTLRAIRL